MRIAIVEDQPADQARLSAYIAHYFREEMPETACQVVTFENAVSFLDPYQANYDLIFFDIQMPMMDGMQAAEKLRRMDPEVPIIFVTNMAQYAVRGYDVNALGFILKPVSYYDFFLRMRKAMNLIASRAERLITISSRGNVIRIKTADLYYIEVRDHQLLYHGKEQIWKGTGSLTDLEERLRDSGFLRCNSCYLVNPHAIQLIKGLDITLENGDVITISHAKRKQFMSAMSQWLGKGQYL